jgi:hypothetical protein
MTRQLTTLQYEAQKVAANQASVDPHPFFLVSYFSVNS